MIATSLEAPETEMERQLAQIWSDLLNVDLSRIGRHTSFFELGGDSISVIQLISRCKVVGIALTTSVVFKKSTLSQLAKQNESEQTRKVKDLKVRYLFHNFSEDVKNEIAKLWMTNCEASSYEVYPASPLQTGVIARTLKDKNAYSQELIYEISNAFEPKKLETALEILFNSHDILRTKFVTTSKGVFHVLQQNVVPELKEFEDLESCLHEYQRRGFGMDEDSWFRVAIVRNNQKCTHMVISLHHVIYDGWCLDRLLLDLMKLYGGLTIQRSLPFKRVIEYIYSQDIKETERFWKDYLHDLVPAPQLNRKQFVSAPDTSVIEQSSTVSMDQLSMAASVNHLTPAVVAKAAWAITLAMYTQQADVVFGNVISGRDMDIEGIERYIPD
jgi:aryl carrier-like protein